MQLSTEALEQFKKMYMDMYKIQLTNQQAVEYGTRLILLVKAVYGKDLPKRLDKKIKQEDN
jgi:hypothetical protein